MNVFLWFSLLIPGRFWTNNGPVSTIAAKSDCLYLDADGQKRTNLTLQSFFLWPISCDGKLNGYKPSTRLWLQWHFLEGDTCNCINVASVTVLQGVCVLIALLMRLFRSFAPPQPPFCSCVWGLTRSWAQGAMKSAFMARRRFSSFAETLSLGSKMMSLVSRKIMAAPLSVFF